VKVKIKKKCRRIKKGRKKGRKKWKKKERLRFPIFVVLNDCCSAQGCEKNI